MSYRKVASLFSSFIEMIILDTTVLKLLIISFSFVNS